MFSVKSYLNPPASDFSILVNSIGVTPITVTLRDMSGQLIKVINTAPKGNLVKLGNDLRGGVYIAEVAQGSNKQHVKLVKLN